MTRRTDGPFVIYEILPGQLFQRGKLHNTATTPKLAGLEHYGITLTVALAPTKADPELDPMTHLHHPIPDGLLSDETAEWLLTTAWECATAIQLGSVVLTMCNAGRNRSGLLSALIVRELTGLPGSAAMAVVRYHRPNAIANPNFEGFLRSLP